MNPTPKTYAAIYARKSTAQQGDEEARSVARQIANARTFAEARGWQVLDEHIYADDGVSGAADIKALRAKQRMLGVIAAGAPFHVLVMQSNDRLSRRDADESFAELKQIANAGVDV
jgi:DNA invertase Pin-like site-specific DNA recombinase